MVADTVYPQHGDEPDAANFASLAGASNRGDYVESGLSLTVDYTVPDFDISAGKAFILGSTMATATPDIDPSETRQDVAFVVEVESRTGIALSANAVNYVFLDANVGTDDAPSIVVKTTDTAPSDESIKIAEVDTSANTKNEDFNRAPAATFASIDPPATRSFVAVGGNLDVATGNQLRDGSGTTRFAFNSSDTRMNDDGGVVAFEADDAAHVKIFAESDRPVQIWDSQGGFTSVQYDTDTAAGVLRTPNAGARIESDGTSSSGEGIELDYDTTNQVGNIRAYDRTNSASLQLTLSGSTVALNATGGLIDASPSAANLRLATGQSIEIGDGSNAITVASGATSLRRPDNGFRGVASQGNGNGGILRKEFTGGTIVYDANGGFSAVSYNANSSAPGTLELTNAMLEIQGGNNLTFTSNNGRISWPNQGGTAGSAHLQEDLNGEIYGQDDDGNQTTLT